MLCRRAIASLPKLEHVRFEMDEHVKGLGIITLYRPASRDALSPEMAESIVALKSYLNALSPGNLRCVLLTGSSEKSFSSGRDLKVFMLNI